jgi:hypothetical protein
MEKGIIFTKDKKDIEVFFLKPQGSFSPHPSEPNTWIVNDPETAQALIDDNKDCCEELRQELNEQDVNEAAAALQGFVFEPSALQNIADMGGDWPHALTPQGASFPTHPDDLDKFSTCCPTGHEGHQGSIGVTEDEADIFESICECLEKFSATDLSIDNPDSRAILSITIVRKIKNL